MVSTTSSCYFTRDNHLVPFVYRYPILGDFEKQSWLDQYCRNPEVDPSVNDCTNPYFADFALEPRQLVCRTTNMTSTCPQNTNLNKDLVNLIKGKVN